MTATLRARVVTHKKRIRYKPSLASHASMQSPDAMLCPSFFMRSVFCTLVAACCTGALRAQAPGNATPPAATTVQPTVTPEMGDVGGKFFGKEPDPKKTRHYYIAAEPELWNFAPQGVDPVCGKVFPPTLLLNRVSWKIRYVQYADPNFSARVLPSDRLGIMGPVLRGVAGEYIAVTFLNRSWAPVSMHPHGLRYDKDSEGSYYKPAPGRGAAVAPGAKFTYVWQLDEQSGPRSDEPSSKAWLYHSHVRGDEETNLGLFGCIVVTDPARARPDGTPNDVDREMAALFMIFDESNMPDSDNDEPEDRPPGAAVGPITRTWAEIRQYTEEGERHTINGRTFGNLAGLEINEGERVRWYLFGLGSEKDFHTAHWHGMRVTQDGRRATDAIELLPASMKIADMRADNPGQWLLHCHVGEHMSEGMFARFTVHPKSDARASREPEVAFFGMKQSEQTLRIQNAELALDGAASEIDLEGRVTVPDPFPVARNEFAVQVGGKTIAFRPDSSGLCVVPEGMLLLKNVPPYGNGNVTGGTLNFELMLKGAGWPDELQKLGTLKNGALVPDASLSLNMQVGNARHSASAALKIAPPVPPDAPVPQSGTKAPNSSN